MLYNTGMTIIWKKYNEEMTEFLRNILNVILENWFQSVIYLFSWLLFTFYIYYNQILVCMCAR